MPSRSTGKDDFPPVFTPTKSVQRFSDTHSLAPRRLFLGRDLAVYSSTAKTKEKGDTVFRKPKPGLDCKEGESWQLQVTQSYKSHMEEEKGGIEKE